MRDPQLEPGAGRGTRRDIAHQSAFEDRSGRDLSLAHASSIEAKELRPGGPHGARMSADVRRRSAGLADAGTSASRIRGDAPDTWRASDRELDRPADDERPGEAGGHEPLQFIRRIRLSRRRRSLPDDFLLDGQTDLSPWHKRVLHDRLRRDRHNPWSGVPSLRRWGGLRTVGSRSCRAIRVYRAKGGRTFSHATGGPLDPSN